MSEQDLSAGQQAIDDVLTELTRQVDEEVPRGGLTDEIVKKYARQARKSLRESLVGRDMPDEQLRSLCDQLIFQLFTLFTVREFGLPTDFLDQLQEES